MLKIRTALAVALIFVVGIFIYQNLSWAYGLYAIGQDAIEAPELCLDKRSKPSVFLVKANQRQGSLFIYRISALEYFKLPVWPFTKTMSTKLHTKNLVLTQDLFSCDFRCASIFSNQDLECFTDMLITAGVLIIVISKFLLAKHKTAVDKKLIYPGFGLYH